MINRKLLYSSIAVGVSGTVVLFFMNRMGLSAGWWSGIAIGLVNFSTLLTSVERSKEDPEGPKKLQKLFFLRYIVLAVAFFLVIQLGKDQLGSAVLGFLSLYLTFFAHYLLRLKKSKEK